MKLTLSQIEKQLRKMRASNNVPDFQTFDDKSVFYNVNLNWFEISSLKNGHIGNFCSVEVAALTIYKEQ